MGTFESFSWARMILVFFLCRRKTSFAHSIEFRRVRPLISVVIGTATNTVSSAVSISTRLNRPLCCGSAPAIQPSRRSFSLPLTSQVPFRSTDVGLRSHRPCIRHGISACKVDQFLPRFPAFLLRPPMTEGVQLPAGAHPLVDSRYRHLAARERYGRLSSSGTRRKPPDARTSAVAVLQRNRLAVVARLPR